MAGVGISEHKDGFPGTLAKELSEKLKVNIKLSTRLTICINPSQNN
mgnify:CR=1 FL=1